MSLSYQHSANLFDHTPSPWSSFRVRGRMGRWAFLSLNAALMLIVALTALIDQALHHHPYSALVDKVFGAVLLSSFILSIILIIKRVHDLNYSSLTLFLLIVPFVNVLVYVGLFVFRGSEGMNRYGSVPRPSRLSLVGQTLIVGASVAATIILAGKTGFPMGL